MTIWDDVIPDSDRDLYAKGLSSTVGFGQKPAVLVVDMNYGCIELAPGASKLGRPATEAVCRLLGLARTKKVPIVFTTSPLGSVPAQKGYWKTRDPVKPALGTPDPNCILEVLGPQEGEPLVTKLRPSAFFGTNLVDMLIFHGTDTLIITGANTSGCVRATVIDAFSYNYRVIVPVECCSDRAIVPHKVNLFDMHRKYADVIRLDTVLQHLERLPVP